MKKVFIGMLAALMLLSCLSSAAFADSINMFEADEIELQSLNNFAFSTDPADAPTDEELTAMLHFAMHSGSAHTLSPAHFVVIRDVEEQQSIASGLSAFGMPNPTSEGTVLVLTLADTLRDQEHHADAYNGWYSQMYYGIYDAGAAAAYLALAAQSMGYGIHQIAAMNIPLEDTGEVDILANGGNFGLVTGNYWDVSKYLTSKDGEVDFTHTVSIATMPPASQSMDIKADGNLTLLSAMVIGKRATDVDAVSSATMGYPEDLANFNFWDPQDGISYGKSVPAGEAVVSGLEDIDLSNVPDGVYEGSAVSTSSEYTVQVTVKDNAITDLQIVRGQQNMRMPEADRDAYLQSILDAQSILVDGVSGASEDSAGILNAIKDALAK